MATLWMPTSHGDWTPLVLGRDETLEAARFGQTNWRLVPLAPPASGMALFSRPPVAARVNGERVAGLHVLEHQDEVCIAGTRFWFSRESRPTVSVYRRVDGGRLPKCAVCSMPIQDGDTIVGCPGCGRRHHHLDATAERPQKHCFTYHPACRFCEHPTALDGAPGWQPERDFEVCDAT